MMRCWISLLAILSVLLSACDSKPEAQRQQPVVVYAVDTVAASLPELFRAFTADTGIAVTVRHGNAQALVNDVIANRGSPAADVLLTTNIADTWRAADKGALRPIQAAHLQTVPAVLKDPDGLWAALDYRLAVIATHPEPGILRPVAYTDLAGAQYHGKVCMVSSRLAISRSLLAMLIAELGSRPAERVVRGWLHNLALPPFDTEQKLLLAIKSGVCEYGMLSDSIVDADVDTIVPQPVYIDIDGIGIARHARHPEAAQRLLEWMLAMHAPALQMYSNERNIGIAGWRDEDAVSLAERVGYE